MSKVERIIISEGETVAKSWARDASALALFCGLIGIGVYVGSTAMQWVGALVGFIVIMAKSGTVTHKLTIPEAQDYINDLAAREEGQS